MTTRLILIASVLALSAAPVVAEIYRNVDAQGNVTYSDEPSRGAEAIEVQPVTTVTLPKLDDVAEAPGEPATLEQSPDTYQVVTFVAPRNDEAFHSGSGDVEFQVTSTPALKPGHKYEVALDGQPVGQSTSGNIMVRNVFRGTHQADVHIVNRDGARIQSGDSISFTIHRPTVARPVATPHN